MKIRSIAIGFALAGIAATAQAGETSRLDTVSVNAGFEAPRVIATDNATAPRYPEVALHARAEGQVQVVAAIGADGQVGDVQVVSSSGTVSLDRAAIALVKAQRYAPAQLDAQPIAVHARIPVTFALQAAQVDTRIASVELN